MELARWMDGGTGVANGVREIFGRVVVAAILELDFLFLFFVLLRTNYWCLLNKQETKYKVVVQGSYVKYTREGNEIKYLLTIGKRDFA